MSRAKVLPVDEWRLRDLLSYKGPQCDVAEAIGFSQSALSKVFTRKVISYSMMARLEEVCGVKYEDYKPEDAPARVTSRSEALTKALISQVVELRESVNRTMAILERIADLSDGKH